MLEMQLSVNRMEHQGQPVALDSSGKAVKTACSMYFLFLVGNFSEFDVKFSFYSIFKQILLKR